MPQEVVSDRGTNFIGANRELEELVEKLAKDKICQRTANRGVTWIFNPPQEPHFGGAHKIMIKAAKKAIHAVLGEANVTDEELMTAFIGAESLLNSRPITYQTANPCDQTLLTPNHFLYGQAGGTFAPDSVDETIPTKETMAEGPRTHLTFLASLAQRVATKPKCTIAVEQREKRFESWRCGARHLQ